MATTTAKNKLKYTLEFTIGEKRAVLDLLNDMKVVDIPDKIDIVQLKKAFNKIRNS